MIITANRFNAIEAFTEYNIKAVAIINTTTKLLNIAFEDLHMKHKSCKDHQHKSRSILIVSVVYNSGDLKYFHFNFYSKANIKNRKKRHNLNRLRKTQNRPY